MNKFIPLKVFNLKLDDVEGLIYETISAVIPKAATLGAAATVKFQALVTKNDTFVLLLDKDRTSLLTPQINEEDRKRDSLFSEIKRTSKTAQKSNIPSTAIAGARMVDLLTPFWDINKKPIATQTAEINHLIDRYNADPDAVASANTLGLAPVINRLAVTNLELHNLYGARVDEIAAAVGPSASSIKSEVVIAYDEFCDSVGVTLSALPTENLQLIFNAVNEIRHKYVSRLPIPLSESHTSVAPIAEQVRTGKHITPVPRVFFDHDGKLDELVFAQDFTVTYRNPHCSRFSYESYPIMLPAAAMRTYNTLFFARRFPFGFAT
jgi:hypothetical protein